MLIINPCGSLNGSPYAMGLRRLSLIRGEMPILLNYSPLYEMNSREKRGRTHIYCLQKIDQATN